MLIQTTLILFFAAADQPSYSGQLRLFAPLTTVTGAQLAVGSYDVDVRPSESSFVLELRSEGQVRATLTALSKADESKAQHGTMPVAPTQYLRSSADPILSVEERHNSKTGRAQYQDEARDWKAALRTYKDPVDGGVYFVFQERQKDGTWRSTHFRLAATK